MSPNSETPQASVNSNSTSELEKKLFQQLTGLLFGALGTALAVVVSLLVYVWADKQADIKDMKADIRKIQDSLNPMAISIAKIEQVTTQESKDIGELRDDVRSILEKSTPKKRHTAAN